MPYDMPSASWTTSFLLNLAEPLPQKSSHVSPFSSPAKVSLALAGPCPSACLLCRGRSESGLRAPWRLSWMSTPPTPWKGAGSIDPRAALRTPCLSQGYFFLGTKNQGSARGLALIVPLGKDVEANLGGAAILMRDIGPSALHGFAFQALLQPFAGLLGVAEEREDAGSHKTAGVQRWRLPP